MSQGWRFFPFAALVSWHDGDTCAVEVDQGFGGSQTIHVRVYGVSAPELHGHEAGMGAIALKGVKSWTGPIQLWTWKQSFDRYVGRMVTQDGQDIGERILFSGLARAWDGVTARPVFGDFPIRDGTAEVALYAKLLARDFKAT